MVLGLQLAAAGGFPGVGEHLLQLQDIPDITESLDGAAAAVGSWGDCGPMLRNWRQELSQTLRELSVESSAVVYTDSTWKWKCQII